jgi:hypothetical protein
MRRVHVWRLCGLPDLNQSLKVRQHHTALHVRCDWGYASTLAWLHQVHEMQEKDGRDSVMFDEGQRFAEMGNWDSIHELGAMY